MAVLQVFQAKMLTNKDAGLDSASLRDLRSATDQALHATKATAQAIGRSMSSLIILERHLWLTMTEMKEADKIPFLDAPFSSGSLFGPAVEGFAECFTEAQKSSQAMRHFLPKCTSSSSASSRPKSAPTLPSETDTQLPQQLAHFGPVTGGFDIAQDPPPQPLRLPGAQGQLCQERTVTQPTGIVPGYSYRLGAERATSIQHHAASFKEGTTRPLKAFQKMLGLMAVVLPVVWLGLLRMQPIHFWLKQRVPVAAWRHRRHRVTVTRACVSALTCWRNPLWLKRGVTLDTAHRRKVVTTDASNKGWGALCPAFDLWSEEESTLHINCLEMLAVCQACQIFLPVIRGHHVLVCSDSRSVVSYINHQGSLISKRHCMQANDLLVWAQNNLCSLKATHVPAKMNLGADMLWRNNVSLDVLPAHGSENLLNLRQGSSRPLRLQR